MCLLLKHFSQIREVLQGEVSSNTKAVMTCNAASNGKEFEQNNFTPKSLAHPRTLFRVTKQG